MQDGGADWGKQGMVALPKAVLAIPLQTASLGIANRTVAIVIRMSPQHAQLEGSEVKVHEGPPHSTSFSCSSQSWRPLLLCVMLLTAPSQLSEVLTREAWGVHHK